MWSRYTDWNPACSDSDSRPLHYFSYTVAARTLIIKWLVCRERAAVKERKINSCNPHGVVVALFLCDESKVVWSLHGSRTSWLNNSETPFMLYSAVRTWSSVGISWGLFHKPTTLWGNALCAPFMKEAPACIYVYTADLLTYTRAKGSGRTLNLMNFGFL